MMRRFARAIPEPNIATASREPTVIAKSLGVEKNGVSDQGNDVTSEMRPTIMSVRDSQLEAKSDAIESGRGREDRDSTADRAGHRMSEAGFREPPVPAAEAQQAQNGREHLGDEISQQYVGPRHCHGRAESGRKALGTDIGEEMKAQPQAGGDRAGPEAPGRGGAIFVDAVEAVQEPRAKGATGDK